MTNEITKVTWTMVVTGKQFLRTLIGYFEPFEKEGKLSMKAQQKLEELRETYRTLEDPLTDPVPPKYPSRDKNVFYRMYAQERSDKVK